MGTVIDLTGQRFGRLQVISFCGFTNAKKAKWLCKCDCGNYREVIGVNLRNGNTKSCGCYCSEKIIERNTKHGFEGTKICMLYRNMKSRCSNKNNKAYKYYGGRGIKVCEEWSNKENGLKNFVEWAYSHGYDEKTERGKCTLDRIDVNGDYCPENCRWVDLFEQANNKTNNVIIEYMGEKDTVQNWCKRLNVSAAMVRHRIERGWSEERLFDKPKINPVFITYHGETKTIREWSEITGIKCETIRSRLQSNWDIENLFNPVNKK